MTYFACFAVEQTMYRLTEMNTFKTHHIISQDIESAFNTPETSDLTFIISGRPIYTHRAILRIRCEYFKSMLTINNWKESRTSEIIAGLNFNANPFLRGPLLALF